MRKRDRSSVDSAVVDIWQREVGKLSTRNFAHRLAASEDLVLRLDLLRKLDKHRGCVNTISFNADGNILVSGSDDRRVLLWDWETGHVKLSFHSGHSNNIFQAKIMPETDDRSIVTCAADGQVRHARILEGGDVNTKLLAKHQGRAHKLAIEPGSPHIFYTCGEDGLVQHFDLRTGAATELFTCQPVHDRSYMPVVNLNAIAIDPRNPNLFAVAGSDEFTRLYDIRKYKWDGSADFGQPADYFCPVHLIGDENVGITGLAFSDQSELLVSYNDEFIYLFSKDMGLGTEAGEMATDLHSADTSSEIDADVKVGPQVYKGHRNCETVKGVNFFGPKCEYVVSGSDCGRMFIWRKKDGELIRVVEADKHVVNCVESHPHTTVLASSGIETDIKIWTPKAIDKAVLPTNIEKALIPNRFRFHPLADIYDDSDDEYYYDLTDDENDDGDDDDGDGDGDEDEDEDDIDDGDGDGDEWEEEDCSYDSIDDDHSYENPSHDDADHDHRDGSVNDLSDDNPDDFDVDDGGGRGGGNAFDGIDALRPKSRRWMYYRTASPRDLMLQLFSLQRQMSSPERNAESSDAERQLLELILTFSSNNDASSDDGGDEAPERASYAEDC